MLVIDHETREIIRLVASFRLSVCLFTDMEYSPRSHVAKTCSGSKGALLSAYVHVLKK